MAAAEWAARASIGIPLTEDLLSRDRQGAACGGFGSFVTGGSQNPTMTILSLSMRASEYLAEQMRAGNV